MDATTTVLRSPTYLALGTVVVLALGTLFFYPSRALRWMQRKYYQYEVTFALYMMTPTERFIFNSILFLFLAMVTIAASLYLPEHITKISRRAYYYALGDADATNASLRAVNDLLAKATISASSSSSSAVMSASVVSESVQGMASQVAESVASASSAAAKGLGAGGLKEAVDRVREVVEEL